MVTGIAGCRLMEERKKWRKDHPIGFYARPLAKGDGSSDLFKWEAGIPGKKKTDWEGGLFKVVLHFSPDYPSKAPLVKFTPPIFHPNVYQDGEVCLSILTDEWAPSISVKAILVGVQDLLDTPNPRSPANGEANMYFTKNKAAYKNRVKAEALKYKPLEEF